MKNLVPPGLEPGTFRVLSERDNHYTTGLLKRQPTAAIMFCDYDKVITSRFNKGPS